jgi:hypothetical protein
VNAAGGVALPAAAADCQIFDPELVASGWIFHDISNPRQCLAPVLEA